MSMENEFPLPRLMAGAAALHENMMSFVEVGFTREEALQIVIAMLLEAVKDAKKQDSG